jgi:hypothetical protein
MITRDVDKLLLRHRVLGASHDALLLERRSPFWRGMMRFLRR